MQLKRYPEAFRTTRRPWLAAVAGVLGLWAGPAPAAVVEITQDTATGGIDPNDAAGFPVTITAGGVYRLAGNLTVSDSSKSGFDIKADNVELDLNGYTLQGPIHCDGTPVTCSQAGNGRDGFGVEVDDELGGVIEENLPTNTVVRNGVIRGFASGGMRLVSPGATVEDLRIEQNNLVGIQMERLGVIRRNVVTTNGGVGIDAGFSGLSVYENVVGLNLSDGMHIGPGCTVLRNTIFGNKGVGIGGPSTSAGDGGATLLENNVSSNTGLGLSVPSGLQVGYASNAFTLNNGGNASAQVSGGVEIGNNLCGTSRSCTGLPASALAPWLERLFPLLVVGFAVAAITAMRRRA
jgi:parallel beta helix pectate lyase-like protein